MNEQDPVADAIARGLTFERTQEAWICHHLTNALVGAMYGNEDQRAASCAHIMAVVTAVREQTRPPYPPVRMRRCIVCDRIADLGPGCVCAECSDEEVLP